MTHPTPEQVREMVGGRDDLREGQVGIDERVRIIWSSMGNRVAVAKEQIRQAEQAARDKALEERDAEWTRWLSETRIAVAEQNFDIETAIMCGSKKPTLHDAGQCGYAAALFAWEAAIQRRPALKDKT